jgi:hypothetical protein
VPAKASFGLNKVRLVTKVGASNTRNFTVRRYVARVGRSTRSSAGSVCPVRAGSGGRGAPHVLRPRVDRRGCARRSRGRHAHGPRHRAPRLARRVGRAGPARRGRPTLLGGLLLAVDGADFPVLISIAVLCSPAFVFWLAEVARSGAPALLSAWAIAAYLLALSLWRLRGRWARRRLSA